MTMTLVLKSGVTGNCYAPFGSGAGGSDSPGDHNWAALPLAFSLARGYIPFRCVPFHSGLETEGEFGRKRTATVSPTSSRLKIERLTGAIAS